jgi:hypothetical protein
MFLVEYRVHPTTKYSQFKSILISKPLELNGIPLSRQHTKHRINRSDNMTIRVQRPRPPLVIRQRGITIPGNGGVGT